MGGQLGAIVLWFAVLAVAVWAADWGAERVALPFQKLKVRWGLTGAAGGALLALITASPEVGINTAAAVQGVADIGLGNMLGANIVSVPAIVVIAYGATRWYRHHSPSADQAYGRDAEAAVRNRPDGLILEPASVTVQAVPYLVIVVLVGVLTLPAPWRGLDPVDGWIMLAAFFVFYGQAILRGRGRGEAVEWNRRENLLAVAGVLAVAGGAYLAVTATEQLVGLFGISRVVGGLFISATMSVVPEAIKTWVMVRVGQATAGTTSVIADNAVTMTLGFLPLALIGTPVGDVALYTVNLAFVFLFGALFAVVTPRANRFGGMRLRHVSVIAGTYGAYLVAVLGFLL